jgi:hypothetical protein
MRDAIETAATSGRFAVDVLRQNANDDAAVLRAAVLRGIRRHGLLLADAEHADLVERRGARTSSRSRP